VIDLKKELRRLRRATRRQDSSHGPLLHVEIRLVADDAGEWEPTRMRGLLGVKHVIPLSRARRSLRSTLRALEKTAARYEQTQRGDQQ
jgi:hypothetical protein